MANGTTSTLHLFSIGEIYLFGMLMQLSLMRADCLGNYPALKKWFDGMAADPRSKKVLEGSSAIGALAQYFVSAE